MYMCIRVMLAVVDGYSMIHSLILIQGKPLNLLTRFWRDADHFIRISPLGSKFKIFFDAGYCHPEQVFISLAHTSLIWVSENLYLKGSKVATRAYI